MTDVAALMARVITQGDGRSHAVYPDSSVIADHVLAALADASLEVAPAGTTDALAAERERAEVAERVVADAASRACLRRPRSCEEETPGFRLGYCGSCLARDLLGRISRDHEGPTP